MRSESTIATSSTRTRGAFDARVQSTRADLAAGGVARVQHAAHAVRGLAPERRRPGRIAIERGAPVEQLLHVAGAVVHQHVHGLAAAQAVARLDGVARVQRRRVVGAHRGRHAALRVAGVALAGIGLGQHEHVAHVAERDRRAQPGHAAADDEEISAQTHECYPNSLTETPAH